MILASDWLCYTISVMDWMDLCCKHRLKKMYTGSEQLGRWKSASLTAWLGV